MDKTQIKVLNYIDNKKGGLSMQEKIYIWNVLVDMELKDLSHWRNALKYKTKEKVENYIYQKSY